MRRAPRAASNSNPEAGTVTTSAACKRKYASDTSYTRDIRTHLHETQYCTRWREEHEADIRVKWKLWIADPRDGERVADEEETCLGEDRLADLGGEIAHDAAIEQRHGLGHLLANQIAATTQRIK